MAYYKSLLAPTEQHILFSSQDIFVYPRFKELITGYIISDKTIFGIKESLWRLYSRKTPVWYRQGMATLFVQFGSKK